MKFYPDPRLRRELLDRLSNKYMHDKPFPHLTELTYCLTKSWYERFDPVEPTEKELLLFCIGFGLETVILRDEGDKDIESRQMDGVWLTLDYIDMEGVGVDLKSTRMSPGPDGSPSRGFSEKWLQKCMAYARLLGQTNFQLAAIYLRQPELGAGTLVFTEEEIEANWAYVKARLAILMEFIAKGEIPTEYKYAESWECNDCRYAMRCSARSLERKRAVGGQSE